MCRTPLVAVRRRGTRLNAVVGSLSGSRAAMLCRVEEAAMSELLLTFYRSDHSRVVSSSWSKLKCRIRYNYANINHDHTPDLTRAIHSTSKRPGPVDKVFWILTILKGIVLTVQPLFDKVVPRVSARIAQPVLELVNGQNGERITVSAVPNGQSQRRVYVACSTVLGQHNYPKRESETHPSLGIPAHSSGAGHGDHTSCGGRCRRTSES